MSQEKHPRVLVVDDEAEIREVISRMLADMGCEVTCASSADEAVGAFLQGGVDLITLDHRMPGLKGMDLHKVLSQEFGAGRRTTGFTPRKLPPILIVTGFAEDAEVERGQWGEGIVGVLQKPVHKEELKRVVEDLLSLPRQH
jgi:CheY-like chemotaxis protein